MAIHSLRLKIAIGIEAEGFSFSGKIILILIGSKSVSELAGIIVERRYLVLEFNRLIEIGIKSFQFLIDSRMDFFRRKSRIGLNRMSGRKVAFD